MLPSDDSRVAQQRCFWTFWPALELAEILDNYPGLEEADVDACLAYGAEMPRERFVEVGGESAANQV